MFLSTQVICEKRSVSVRELTLREIRAWVAEAEAKQKSLSDASLTPSYDFASMLAFDTPLDDLVRMTDLKEVSDFDDLSQSEIAKIEAECRVLNPAFFKLAGIFRPVPV